MVAAFGPRDLMRAGFSTPTRPGASPRWAHRWYEDPTIRAAFGVVDGNAEPRTWPFHHNYHDGDRHGMRSHQLTLGRTFVVVFDHGEDFFTALADFCCTHDVRQGYIPTFIAGFAEVEIVCTCAKLENPEAPVWSSVHLTNVEAFGGGTLASNSSEGRVHPHIHVAVGLKQHSATGHTSHLLGAQVQFLTEMVFTEIVAPALNRRPDTNLFNVPRLHLSTPEVP